MHSKVVFTGDKLSDVDNEFPIRNLFAGLNKADVKSSKKVVRLYSLSLQG